MKTYILLPTMKRSSIPEKFHDDDRTSEFLVPGTRVVIEFYNLAATETRPMTLLAWDITRAISEVLRFEKEIIACWTEVEDEDTGETPMVS